MNIKLRAWNKKLKKMYKPKKGCDLMVRLDGRMFCQLDIGDSDSFMDVDEKEFVLMLCTGLKDKNNKDIYEGDIYTPWKGGPITVVEYYTGDGEARFIGKRLLRGGPSWSTLRATGQKITRVIGNIYDNPELLVA